LVWLSVLGPIAVGLLQPFVLTKQTSYIVIATSILLSVAGEYVASARITAQAETRDNDRKCMGYSFLISALGIAFLASSPRDFSAPLHYSRKVPYLIWLLNAIGAIILLRYIPDYNDGVAEQQSKIFGTTTLLNGFFFLVAVSNELTTATPGQPGVATWLHLFYCAGHQYIWLNSAILFTKATMFIVALSLVFTATFFMMVYHLYNMAGASAQEMSSTIVPTFKSIRGDLVTLCALACIIGGFTFSTDPSYQYVGNNTGSQRWLMANASFVPILLFMALLTNSERRFGLATIAAGITVQVTPALVQLTDLLHSQRSHLANNTNEGVYALMVASVWFSWFVYGVSSNVKQASFGGINILRIFAIMVTFAGLCAWWKFDDEFYSITLGYSVQSLIGIFLVIGAYWFTAPPSGSDSTLVSPTTIGHIRSVAMFFITSQGAAQLAIALQLNENYGPFTPNWLTTGRAGTCVAAAGSVLLLIAYIIEGSVNNDTVDQNTTTVDSEALNHGTHNSTAYGSYGAPQVAYAYQSNEGVGQTLYNPNAGSHV
jgi:hypothetical protein